MQKKNRSYKPDVESLGERMMPAGLGIASAQVGIDVAIAQVQRQALSRLGVDFNLDFNRAAARLASPVAVVSTAARSDSITPGTKTASLGFAKGQEAELGQAILGDIQTSFLLQGLRTDRRPNIFRAPPVSSAQDQPITLAASADRRFVRLALNALPGQQQSPVAIASAIPQINRLFGTLGIGRGPSSLQIQVTSRIIIIDGA